MSGGLLLTVSLLVFAWGGSFSVLVAACVAMGVADSLLVGPLEAALAEEPPQHLDRLLAVQHALSFGGDLIGPLLLGIGAATVLGWRFAFVATALATLAFTAFVAATPLPGPAPAVQGDGPATRHGLLAVVARPDVLLLVVVEVLLGSLDEPLLAFVVARTAGELSTRGPEQLLAGAVMVGGVAGSLVIARVGGASLVRRVGPWLLALGAAVSAVPAGIVVGVVAMAAVGLGMAMVWAGVHHRMLTIVPGRVGTVSALSSIVGALGVGAPVLGGALADRFGLTVALAAFSALAVLVALLVPVVVPERGGGRRRREGRRHRGRGSPGL